MKKLKSKTIILCFYLLIFCCLFSKFITKAHTNEPKQQNLNNNYNVILITVNVLRYDHLGCYGYHRKTSPAIDELAKESLVFKNAFTQAGYTLPNMMSIITSLYPKSHGVFDAFKDKLSSRIYTLAEILKIYGYATAWFAMLKEPHLDIDIGFGKGYDFKAELDRNFGRKRQILSWIKKNKNDRFFIAINNRHTHTPYLPLSKYKNSFKAGNKGAIFNNREDLNKAVFFNILKKINTPGSQMHTFLDKKTISLINNLQNLTIYDKMVSRRLWQRKIRKIESLIPQEKRYRLGQIYAETYNSTIDISNEENIEYLVSLYDACILGVDQELIRPIISTLKKLNIYDNTIIIITGDHGESLGEHSILGHGMHFYEQFIHVPLIIKFPFSGKGKKIDGLVQSIDIMPTVLSYLDIELPFNVQGKSLLPLIQSKTTKFVHEYVFGENRQFAYLRSNKWKLIVDRENIHSNIFHNDKLYDIEKDPEELDNLIITNPDIYIKLRKILKEHIDTSPKYFVEKYTYPSFIDKATQERIKETGYW